ncbi:MAG TPA: carbon monoxide dehydrogenase subunit G [Gammaproteobacteria bacterium]|nr:carbon monoxide dehydrogenase subunit G [Gammaproteobacteria bacterium]
MDINGEYIIPSSRATVWAALNDPETLQACIPGCEELMRSESGDGFDARVLAKIGPVKATFRGGVRFEDVVPEQGYSIVGEGKGGPAGFAKLKANVKLEDAENGATRLTYTADAQLGGKLAQLGSRLIEGTARKYADDFFTSLTARLTPATDTSKAEASAAAPAAKAAPTAGGSSRLMLYALGAAAATVLIIAFL